MSAHLPSTSASKTLLNTWSPGKVKQTLTYTLYIYTNPPDFQNVNILINYNTAHPLDLRLPCPVPGRELDTHDPPEGQSEGEQ